MVCQNILPNSHSNKDKERDAGRGREEDGHAAFLGACHVDSARLWCFLWALSALHSRGAPLREMHFQIMAFFKSVISLHFVTRHHKTIPNGHISGAGERRS